MTDAVPNEQPREILAGLAHSTAAAAAGARPHDSYFQYEACMTMTMLR
jgi:hypothetical protein